ncbi:type II secretion system F family protein [Paenibacillus rigui]|nr:type II secretion system F family protein [Paenibacillus rigui]
MILLTAGLSWLALYVYQRLQQKQKHKGGSPAVTEDTHYSSGLMQYEIYRMSGREKFWYSVIGIVVLGIIGYLFYKNGAAAAVISIAGLYYPVIRKKELVRKQKTQLRLQFKQMLSSLSSALGAGKSVESAFDEALMDMQLLYPDPRTFIIKELETIRRRVENGDTIEYALKDWSERSGIEDIQQFTEVFMTCKRTGGNMVQVIRRTASIIQEKLDIQQDIQVMMAQKRFESRVLTFAPLIVIAVLSFSSPDYMEPVYQGIGVMIMTVALIVLIGCYALTKMIMNIKV